ncbi:type II secretion system major pseudopilin GspG [Xanthomonas sp. XNM01]|uniref:type II secretion system major pseudopilin GspG n=1 Tax=Xanthomonas sp. XNM01 TaxID=2769289 RepID=UPI001785CCD1|nr:type II secretion system major pseudopilin GspG [Xanthomonas sp. XNM01]MBD9369579.1 type II secretion system major pseudopilin GspG [Xanthomonas sp. XNM01]
MNRNASNRRARNAGFTLLEMLVVLVIIGLIASLVGPRLFSRVDSSKVQVAETQVRLLRGAIETFRLEVGRIPTTDEGLAVLYTAPADERAKARWRGPYLDEAVPADPWGNPYRYSTPGRDGLPFAIYSLGADGEPGGEGINADVGFLPPQ